MSSFFFGERSGVKVRLRFYGSEIVGVPEWSHDGRFMSGGARGPESPDLTKSSEERPQRVGAKGEWV